MVHCCVFALQIWENNLQTLKEMNMRALCAATKKKKLMAEILVAIRPPGEEFNLAMQVPFVNVDPQGGICFLFVRKIILKVILIMPNILVTIIVKN